VNEHADSFERERVIGNSGDSIGLRAGRRLDHQIAADIQVKS